MGGPAGENDHAAHLVATAPSSTAGEALSSVTTASRARARRARGSWVDAYRRGLLDRVTVLALRRHRARQLEQKLAVGARYQDSGLVFTSLDRSPIHPLRFSRWFELTRWLG